LSRPRTSWQYRRALDAGEPTLDAERRAWLEDHPQFRFPAPSADPKRDARLEAGARLRAWLCEYLEATNPSVAQQEDSLLGGIIAHAHLAKGMTTMQLYARIEKAIPRDDGTLEVHGICSTEDVDDQGEVVKADAMRAALPDYLRFPTIREMHGLAAAGTALEVDVGADNITRVVARIVDPVAIRKVRERVYRGFSLGGNVLERAAGDMRTITKLKLSEISLVDRPANPNAVCEFWKATLPEPVSGWHCGIAEHDHDSKIAAALCRAQRTMRRSKMLNKKDVKRAKKAAKATGRPYAECLKAVSYLKVTGGDQLQKFDPSSRHPTPEQAAAIQRLAQQRFSEADLNSDVAKGSWAALYNIGRQIADPISGQGRMASRTEQEATRREWAARLGVRG
jgi:hypothetical protein